jgi:hypothetical protein
MIGSLKGIAQAWPRDTREEKQESSPLGIPWTVDLSIGSAVCIVGYLQV